MPLTWYQKKLLVRAMSPHLSAEGPAVPGPPALPPRLLPALPTAPPAQWCAKGGVCLCVRAPLCAATEAEPEPGLVLRGGLCFQNRMAEGR